MDDFYSRASCSYDTPLHGHAAAADSSCQESEAAVQPFAHIVLTFETMARSKTVKSPPKASI